MNDAGDTPMAGPATGAELNRQLTRSLGAIWHHYTGGQPESTTVEITGDRVHCRRTDASNREPEAEAEALAAGRSTDSSGYRNEAMAVVKRLTHRRIVAFIAKSDAKSDVATETFILERTLPRN